MRLTIVNPETFTVIDVWEATSAWPLLRELLAYDPWENHCVWFVTVAGAQPTHAQHNSHGQIVGRHDRLPATAWSA